MKSLIFLFLFLPFLFSGCSNSSAIVSDICEVTQEICTYANLICDHFGHNPETAVIEEATFKSLKKVDVELQKMFSVHSQTGKVITQTERDQIYYDLIAMRNYLKKIYHDLK